jgi:hypothetical protein
MVVMQNFIKEISNKIDKNCAILQLPRIPYPLNGDTANMGDYDHFLVSILDRNHKYSYGAARMDMTKKVPEIETSSFDEFCGIYLDSNAYSNGIQENLLITKFGNPIKSSDNRYKLFVNSSHASTAIESGTRP